MIKNTLVLFIAGGLTLASCSKKTDSAQTDSSSATVTTAPPATPATAPSSAVDMSGMKMTGKIDEDMVTMGKMMNQKLGASDQNYDDRFIGMMIPHHEGAVMMAKDALAKTSKPELKKMAQDIIAAQNKEIAQMKSWDQQWYNHAPAVSSDMQMMNTQMTQELGPAGKEYEDHFIDGMIPHHESAIDMAKDALSKSTHPEIKTLAQSIIASQQKEIDQMKVLRKQWYGH